MQNLIPTNTTASEYIFNLQNLAAQQPNVARMQKLYELAAPFIESRVVFNGSGWDVRLSLSRKNYLHVVDEYAKLDFSKDQNGGSVGWHKIIVIPPIVTNESTIPQKLERERIKQIIDDCQNTIIYTGE